jgi:hypothetical protein
MSDQFGQDELDTNIVLYESEIVLLGDAGFGYRLSGKTRVSKYIQPW